MASFGLVVVIALLLLQSADAWGFRKSLARGVLASAFVAAGAAPAVADSTYTNERYHTTFNYPDRWTKSTGSLSGDRTIEAWVDPNDADTSVSIVYTAIPADYTRLTSFGGGKETLREYLVPRGEGIDCKVVKESIKGETYTLEYIASAPEQPTRHVITAFALRPAESVVGLTVQTKEESYGKNKQVLDSIVPSLKVDNN